MSAAARDRLAHWAIAIVVLALLLVALWHGQGAQEGWEGCDGEAVLNHSGVWECHVLGPDEAEALNACWDQFDADEPSDAVSVCLREIER